MAGRVLAFAMDMNTTTSIPDPLPPPVLPPDDPNAPDIGREPSIDPPPTIPENEPPVQDPQVPPAAPMTI
jgi:hypothetical protein